MFSAARHPEQGALNKQACGTLITSMGADITIARLLEEMRYEPESGSLFYRKSGRRVASDDGAGYLRAWLCNRNVSAHRIAIALATGRWPAGPVDHINGNRSDNRLVNLRECSNSQNSMNRKVQSNNTSGIAGVCWHPRSGKWQVRISVNRKRKHVGLFDDQEEARVAYAAAALRHYGEFTAPHVLALWA